MSETKDASQTRKTPAAGGDGTAEEAFLDAMEAQAALIATRGWPEDAPFNRYQDRAGDLADVG